MTIIIIIIMIINEDNNEYEKIDGDGVDNDVNDGFYNDYVIF